MSQLDIKVDFDTFPVHKYLDSLRAKISEANNNPKTLQDLLSSNVFADFQDHFSKEMGSKGPWEKWSSSYMAAIQGRVAFRKVRGRTIPIEPNDFELWGIKPPRKPGMILQNTGKLRNSFKQGKSSAAGIQWINTAKYAKYHEKGTSNMPQRDFMWLSQKAIRDIGNKILKWLGEP